MRSVEFKAFMEFIKLLSLTGYSEVKFSVDFQFKDELKDACKECIERGVTFKVIDQKIIVSNH